MLQILPLSKINLISTLAVMFSRVRKLLLFTSLVIFLCNSGLAQNTQQNTDTIDTTGQALEELVFLGSRAGARTNTSAPVPVDIIPISKMVTNVAQAEIGAMLNYSAPSFTSTTQTQGDGSDHIDPAALRGLAPDQTLVLVNGKRRHPSALINLNGTFGRGSVGTDLNAIPALAIAKIEVLRDGASAQYGSDAVAGVINIELKKALGTTLLFNVGSNFSHYAYTTEANKGNIQKDIPAKYDKTWAIDGQLYQIGLNQGLALGKKGGFLNFTLLGYFRGYTNRAGEVTGSLTRSTNFESADNGADRDARYLKYVGAKRSEMRGRVGQSQVASGQMFFNAELPIDKQSKVYFFGGLNFRNGVSAALFRKPGVSSVIISEYPKGLLPLISSNIWDGSLGIGYEHEVNGWNFDLSNVAGTNYFAFNVRNSENSTAASPTNIAQRGSVSIDSLQKKFYAGALGFIQNTANLDISKNFPVLQGLNLGFGAVYRYEQYFQMAGELASWANYNKRGSNGLVDPNGEQLAPTYKYTPKYEVDGIQDSLSPRSYSSAGAQGFAGFSPESAISVHRHNMGAYVDLEQNFSKALLVNIAGRYEWYSDFGSNLSGLISARFKLGSLFSLRASAGRGFRAPSLQQRYLTKVSTVATGGGSQQRGSFANESAIARAFGIPALRPEISTNLSAGVTFDNHKGLKITLDAYHILIRNRVIYTGTFSSSNSPEIKQILQKYDANAAVFFANGLDTRTYGADLVASYRVPLNKPHSLQLSLAANYTKSAQVGGAHTGEVLKNQLHRFLSPAAMFYLLQAIPRYKGFLTLNYKYKNLGIFFRESLFGSTTIIDANNNNFYREIRNGRLTGDYYVYEQTIGPVFVSDISVSYDITPKIKLTIGANNLFDAYTDILDARKGSFHKFQNDPNKANYNQISTQGVSAKSIGWLNSDRLTGSFDVGNQFLYSRAVSILGNTGRYLFARVIIKL